MHNQKHGHIPEEEGSGNPILATKQNTTCNTKTQQNRGILKHISQPDKFKKIKHNGSSYKQKEMSPRMVTNGKTVSSHFSSNLLTLQIDILE